MSQNGQTHYKNHAAKMRQRILRYDIYLHIITFQYEIYDHNHLLRRLKGQGKHLVQPHWQHDKTITSGVKFLIKVVRL